MLPGTQDSAGARWQSPAWWSSPSQSRPLFIGSGLSHLLHLTRLPKHLLEQGPHSCQLLHWPSTEMFYSIAGLHELGSIVGPLAVVKVDFAVVTNNLFFGRKIILQPAGPAVVIRPKILLFFSIFCGHPVTTKVWSIISSSRCGMPSLKKASKLP